MKEILSTFEKTEPEIVFEWKDAETEARGWAVINSLKGGAAGGGTRMRKGLDKHEVVSLAKTMEIKFAVSGPAIGGAKSGIDFDPQDPRKNDVLKRWYKAVSPILKSYYGTGGDMNVCEVEEVIPITESFGLWHPQEGVLNGHFNPKESEKIKKIGQLRAGVSKIMEDPRYLPEGGKSFLIADLITGYGVAESVRHTCDAFGESIEGKRVIVQGWGNVAATAASYLAKEGAVIVGIIGRTGGLINEQGFNSEETKKLLFDRKGNELSHPEMLSFDEVNSKIWDVPADIFLPCAASRLVTQDQVERMVKSGVQIISCGANVPFADEQIFYGPICEYADKKMTVIPDFIANCGMARVFAYLMETDAVITDEAIFADVSATMQRALKDVCAATPDRKNLTSLAFRQAIQGSLQ